VMVFQEELVVVAMVFQKEQVAVMVVGSVVVVVAMVVVVVMVVVPVVVRVSISAPRPKQGWCVRWSRLRPRSGHGRASRPSTSPCDPSAQHTSALNPERCLWRS
jgi:hypothetical protein